jgi:hypothetical protein
MIAAVLIIGLSVVLFGYWFRYLCLLILDARAAQAEEANVGAESRAFAFPAVRKNLRDRENCLDGLDRLGAALEEDYRRLSHLLGSSVLADDPIEHQMLVLDYRMMNLWYRLTRRTAPVQACRALSEMANVLGLLAASLDPPGLRNST